MKVTLNSKDILTIGHGCLYPAPLMEPKKINNHYWSYHIIVRYKSKSEQAIISLMRDPHKVRIANQIKKNN